MAPLHVTGQEPSFPWRKQAANADSTMQVAPSPCLEPGYHQARAPVQQLPFCCFEREWLERRGSSWKPSATPCASARADRIAAALVSSSLFLPRS